jgi:hypothetical protein
MALDERVCARPASGDDRHEFVERFGRVERRIVCILESADLSVEAAEHRHSLAVVVSVALVPPHAVAANVLGAAVNGARPDLVCGARTSQPACGVPCGQEGPALGAFAECIGALLAHAGDAAGLHYNAVGGECVEEAADAVGGPAVGALRTERATVLTSIESRPFDRFFRQLRCNAYRPSALRSSSCFTRHAYANSIQPA